MSGGPAFHAELFRLMGRVSPQVPRRSVSLLAELFGGRARREWLLRNQKLDVSLSSSDVTAFRFSVSDFGERGALSPVIREYVSGSGGGYDTAALKRFLEAGAAFGRAHQTTFGIYWGAGRAEPRFKIYFEELSPAFSAAEKGKLVSDAFELRGRARPGGRALHALSAVCLDLAPGRESDFKFYYRRDELPDIRAPKWQISALAALGLEKKCFYYEMRGTKSERIKIYKVYEVGGISDFTPGLREICGFYAQKRCVPVLRRILAYDKFARGAGMFLVPVLFAAGDAAAPRGRTFDSYFCFKPLRAGRSGAGSGAAPGGAR